MDGNNPLQHRLKSWDESDRPREKMIAKGSRALTDAELLAILIGQGNKEENAVMLCRRILHSYDYNLLQLSQASLTDLIKFKGIGEAKAITIAAALELGRRRQRAEKGKQVIIKSSLDAYQVLKSYVEDLPHEEFWILLLNRRHQVLFAQFISRGGISGTVVDAKLIFKPALEKSASSIILCHNHPSGNLQPSKQDLQLTDKLKNAGQCLDIQVIDHLIITSNEYFSFADAGKM